MKMDLFTIFKNPAAKGYFVKSHFKIQGILKWLFCIKPIYIFFKINLLVLVLNYLENLALSSYKVFKCKLNEAFLILLPGKNWFQINH